MRDFVLRVGWRSEGRSWNRGLRPTQAVLPWAHRAATIGAYKRERAAAYGARHFENVDRRSLQQGGLSIR